MNSTIRGPWKPQSTFGVSTYTWILPDILVNRRVAQAATESQKQRLTWQKYLFKVSWHDSTTSSYTLVIISDAYCSTNSSVLEIPPPTFPESFPNNACWASLTVICADTRFTICSSAVSAGSTVAQALLRSASSRGRNKPTSPSSWNSSRLKRLRRLWSVLSDWVLEVLWLVPLHLIILNQAKSLTFCH